MNEYDNNHNCDGAKNIILGLAWREEERRDGGRGNWSWGLAWAGLGFWFMAEFIGWTFGTSTPIKAIAALFTGGS